MGSSAQVLVAGLTLALLLGCGSIRRFPLRAPMWRDTDLDPVALGCRPDPKAPKDTPEHLLCTPDMYVSSFAWDAADHTVFRPISRLFAVDPGGEAVNVNSLDEVPDSSWFVNRIGIHPVSPEEVARGFCGSAALDVNAADGTWIIDKGKSNGANPGFRVTIPNVGKVMLKADPPGEPERATGAAAIAARLYYAAGWWTPCDTVVYFRPSLLSLDPGLTATDNSGVSKVFDRAALDAILKGAARRGPLVRMVASSWLPGRAVGPFTYAGRRDDDPNDVINHEDRRDLRGARLMAAWLGHFDSREQNTMATWIAANERDPDSSPGHIRHWQMDLGDCFGSEWEWEAISRRLNYAYYLDFSYIAEDFITLGIPVRPWDRGRRSPDGAIFGFFGSAEFDPEMWRGGYPNPAFGRMTERDGAWAARIIARFTLEDIEAAVGTADYTDPRHEPFLVRHLLVRQRRILERYLGKLSPLTNLRVAGDLLCGTDLARSTNTFPASHFRYRAAAFAGRNFDEQPASRPIVGRNGKVCVPLAHAASDEDARDDDPSRYLYVDLHNGQAPGHLRAHLYDLGKTRGFRLVGIER